MDVKPKHPAVVSVQTILYRTPVDAVLRTIEALDNSARIGRAEGVCSGFTINIGDASPTRIFSKAEIGEIRANLSHTDQLHYSFFDANLGTAKGHNRLATVTPDVDYLVTSNPDIIPEPRALWRMLAMFNDRKVGFVEARQIPVEHPKKFDPGTGETSWAATAFAMTRRTLFEQLEGFDAESFFMYCDDVDYSWRVREAGFKVVHQPAAPVFHDKSLTLKGQWQPTPAEVRLSAEAALFLAHKWSRDDEVARILDHFDSAGDENQKAAADKFRRRQKAGKLVPQRDRCHRVAEFRRLKFKGQTGTYYADTRYSL